jgi:hypothetical protein
MLFTRVAPRTKSKGLPIGGLLLSKKFILFTCVAPCTKSKGLPIGGLLLSKKNYTFYMRNTAYKKVRGLSIDASHIFYYFQHALHRVQKASGAIGLCSKFIILLIKYTDLRFLRSVHLKYW